MRYLPLFCLLITTLGWGQEQKPSDVPPEYQPPILRDKDDQLKLPASAAKVSADMAVITIKGLCDKSATPSASPCQTIVTRAQFEKLTNALLPNMKPSFQLQVARGYPDLLAMAQAAEARGVDKTPRFQQRLEFARLQILSQELVRQIDEESSHVPDKDIADYYRDHAADFESATMERLFIPKQRGDSGDKMLRVAEELRAKAVSGENFMALQKEGYEAAGMTDVPPNPSLGKVNPASLPQNHAAMFDLKPGEVSQVLTDSTGYYVYKLDSKEVQSLDQVRNEIQKILQRQRKEQVMRELRRPFTTELNPSYFGTRETAGESKEPKSK
jgi:parvulin-like peptidyl-prolyl isomerase